MPGFRDIRSRVVTGAAAGNLTVTGIRVGDRLIMVQDMGVASASLRTEFTITADDTINNTGGTSTAGHLVHVMWVKKNDRGGNIVG